MKTDDTVVTRRLIARHAVNRKHQTPQGSGNPILDFIDSVASNIKQLVTQPLKRFVKAVEAHASILEWLLPVQIHGLLALATWVYNDVKRGIERMIMTQIDALRAWAYAQFKDVYYILALAITVLRSQLTMRIRAETMARVRAVAHAEAQAKQEIRALHQAIEREAARAYHSGDSGHLSAVSILGDAISAAEPTVKHLVGRIVQYAIDLAEIDNPLIRFVAGKLLSYLIDKLGIDKIAGEMLSSLVLPVGHLGAPNGLSEVVTAVCGRLAGLEQWNATFMADGGPEIIHAGEQWRNVDSPVTSIALLGLFTAMVVTPNQWAVAISDTLGVVVSDTITAVAEMIGG